MARLFFLAAFALLAFLSMAPAQAICVVRRGEEKSPDIERFLGSFALVPR
jgi:hypothetical protein